MRKLYLEIHIYTYVTANKKKDAIKLKQSKVGVHGRLWKVKKEGATDVIIL